jgi:hypothetical protein
LLDIPDQAKPDLPDRATVDVPRNFAETTGKRAAILVLRDRPVSRTTATREGGGIEWANDRRGGGGSVVPGGQCAQSAATEHGSGRREPTLVDSLLPIGRLISLFSLSFYLFHHETSCGPSQIVPIVCALVAAGLAYKNGLLLEDIRRTMIDGVAMGIAAIGILLAVFLPPAESVADHSL